MKRICISYNQNGKESDYIKAIKDELESHGIQISETNHLEANVKFKRVSAENQLFYADFYVKSMYYPLNLTKNKL